MPRVSPIYANRDDVGYKNGLKLSATMMTGLIREMLNDRLLPQEIVCMEFDKINISELHSSAGVEVHVFRQTFFTNCIT